jgi:acyl carrier protein
MTTDVRPIVLEKLADFCGTSINALSLVDSTPLQKLDLDSLATLEIIYELEETFGVTVDTEDLQDILTIGDLVNTLRNTVKPAA